MPPIRLSDDELDAVMAAARPLPVERRDAFLQQVVALRACREIGPGAVYRAVAETQCFSIRRISRARPAAQNIARVGLAPCELAATRATPLSTCGRFFWGS
jgi:hypothetical protein